LYFVHNYLIKQKFNGRRALPAIKFLFDTLYFLKVFKTFSEKVFKGLVIYF